MRLLSARRIVCSGILLAAALMLTLLLVKQPHLVLPFTADPTTSHPLNAQIPRAHPRPKDAPYPVSPKPPKGDVPPYPVPDGLRQLESSGGGGEGASSPQGLKEEAPLKVADELWNLIVAHKQIMKDNGQKRAPSTCVPKHHIFFGKVHKTGSSTVANILQRYGFTRDLNFMLPRKRISSPTYNYFTKPGQAPSRARLIPPPVGQHYDIMWNHGIYYSDFYHSVLPPDTIYVSILRHPLQQFQSAFEYFGRMPGLFLNTILQMNVSNPLSVYLHDPAKYEKSKKLSYVRNKQSQDMGMNTQHVLNASLRRQYLHKLDQDFHLVMITEFFDESLVLLRRLMCWDLKDILYIPKNKNNFKKKRDFTSQDLRRHRELNVADLDLYEFFANRFNQTVQRQGSDFGEEVRAFKQCLQKVQKHCRQTGNTEPLPIPATRWNEEFTVNQYDCKLMQKSELAFLNDLMLDAIRKYQRSAVRNRGL